MLATSDAVMRYVVMQNATRVPMMTTVATSIASVGIDIRRGRGNFGVVVVWVVIVAGFISLVA